MLIAFCQGTILTSLERYGGSLIPVKTALHPTCIIIKNFSHIAAVLLVFSIAGGNHNQVTAVLLGFPYWHPCFHAHTLGRITGGKYNAVSCFRVAAYGNAFPAQFRVFLHFNACVKGIAIAMHYMPLSHIVPTSYTPIVSPHFFTFKRDLLNFK